MRRYEHAVDGPWIARQAQFTQRLVDSARQSLQSPRDQDAPDHLMLDTAVNYALERVQDGWALGEGIDGLRALTREASSWIRDALDLGTRLGAAEAERWLQVTLLAADRAPATTIATRIPQEIDGLAEQPPPVSDFVTALAQLVGDRRDLAMRSAAAVVQSSSGLRRTSVGAQHFVGLGELVHATAARDQTAFDIAARLRTAAYARTYDRSEQARRHRHGLLDVRGAAVASVGRDGGLRLPPGHTYLASELINGG